MPPSGGAVW